MALYYIILQRMFLLFAQKCQRHRPAIGHDPCRASVPSAPPRAGRGRCPPARRRRPAPQKIRAHCKPTAATLGALDTPRYGLLAASAAWREEYFRTNSLIPAASALYRRLLALRRHTCTAMQMVSNPTATRMASTPPAPNTPIVGALALASDGSGGNESPPLGCARYRATHTHIVLLRILAIGLAQYAWHRLRAKQAPVKPSAIDPLHISADGG